MQSIHRDLSELKGQKNPLDRIGEDLPFLTELRHDLHAHPELGFEEERTSAIVADLLERAGLKVHRGLGGTGVVGTLQVGNGTRSIAWQAHVTMMAAAQPFLSGAISKTVNMPRDTTTEDIASILAPLSEDAS